MAYGTDRDGRMDAQAALPAELQERLVEHAEDAPYHQQLQEELAADDTVDIDSYADIETWADLRTVFSYHDDDDLQDLDPDDLNPGYDKDALVYSRSSGTTGEPKEIYWHWRDVLDNVEYTADVLDEQGIIPADADWVATTTPNKVLDYTIRGVANRFDGSIDVLEVEPGPIKRALLSGDRELMDEQLGPIADEITTYFEQNDVKVYEDIAPLMLYVGEQLSREQRENVEALLIGGVGTDEETVERLTEEVFPNAELSGWYGDYMHGSNMMVAPAELQYEAASPGTWLEVRDRDDLDTVVDGGEAGELVSHAVQRGFFVPNRRIGDKATRVARDEVDAITAIGRLEED